MSLEYSAGLEPIPHNARNAAEAFIDSNPDLVQLLAGLESAVAVGEQRDFIVERALPFFKEKRVSRKDGEAALTSALVSQWAKLHALNKNAE